MEYKIDISHPHDSFFKKVFSIPKVAKDFLSSRLPKDILQRADLSTLKVEKSSFVSEEMRETHSDMVYSIQIEGEKSYFYVLLEHQSTVDSHQSFRLLEYNVQLWRDVLKKHKKAKLPLIVNIVLYAGKKVYTGDKAMVDAFAFPQEFVKSLRRTYLIDLKSEKEENLKNDKSAYVAEVFMKQAFQRDVCALFENSELLAMFHESPYKRDILIYATIIDKHEPKDILAKIPNLDHKTKDIIMSALQKIIFEKEQQGKKEGYNEAIMTFIKSGLLTQEQVEKLLEKTKEMAKMPLK